MAALPHFGVDLTELDTRNIRPITGTELINYGVETLGGGIINLSGPDIFVSGVTGAGSAEQLVENNNTGGDLYSYGAGQPVTIACSVVPSFNAPSTSASQVGISLGSFDGAPVGSAGNVTSYLRLAMSTITPFWFCGWCQGGGATELLVGASGPPVASNLHYRLRIVFDGNTRITWYVNNSVIASIDTGGGSAPNFKANGGSSGPGIYVQSDAASTMAGRFWGMTVESKP